MDFNYIYEQLKRSERQNKLMGAQLDKAIKEIDYLKSKVDAMEDEWLLGDDIEAYSEWFTLVAEQGALYAEKDEYCAYRLLDDSYVLSERMTLEDLINNYTNVSLEKRKEKEE